MYVKSVLVWENISECMRKHVLVCVLTDFKFVIDNVKKGVNRGCGLRQFE